MSYTRLGYYWGSGDSVAGGEGFEFRGTDRFELRRRLGAGGMGVVYEAFDRDNESSIAVKTLRRVDARALFRLKNEFRSLQDLEHPNLVRLGELVEFDGEWFFTMELVDGVDFLRYVRNIDAQTLQGDLQTLPVTPYARKRGVDDPAEVAAEVPLPRGDITFDEARLRHALSGLARGVHALHAAGKVHRDVKPSNVLVTHADRVVLLDFGLITDISGGQNTESQVLGTAVYMAPEQAASMRVGPPADWYSVGVVLYEALTGRLPFHGSTLSILVDKQKHEPPPPRAHVPEIPEDLDALCRDLLRFEPERRPNALQVLERLGAKTDIPVLPRTTSHGTDSTLFVGRSAELAQMRQCFERARGGEAATVFVHGESGVGKSALIRRAMNTMISERSDTVVLASRCYERELVHYKAFDGVIDALAQFMRKLPESECGPLLPRNASLLQRVFPVLGRVPMIARAPRPRTEIQDPIELRARVFAAIRELLARLAERRPLVVVIDDLHWADPDSLLLLSDVLRPPDAPPMLLLVSSRNPPSVHELPPDVVSIELGVLEPDDARRLARMLLDKAGAKGAASPALLAVDARGHPLYIDELVRRVAVTGEVRGATHLDDIIRARLRELSAEARELLETVAVAGAPTRETLIQDATSLERNEFRKAVSLLRVSRLVRGRGGYGEETLEPFHDRVRDAMLEQMSEADRKRCHTRVAAALEAAGYTREQPDVLLRHLQGAGERRSAAACAEEAGDRAAAVLAFDRAADFYRTALELVTPREEILRSLRIRLAEALVNAGRGAEAADIYLTAAEGADRHMRIECSRLAAEQLLTSGYIERGTNILRTLLSEVGIRYPKTPRRALASVLWNRARLRVRGLGWTETDPREITDAALMRIDLHKTVAYGLGVVDTMRAADFQARGMLLALKTGERNRVGRFLAFGSIYVGAEGGRGLARARQLLTESRRIADTSDDPSLGAWVLIASGFAAYFEGRYPEALALFDQAEENILTLNKGMSWERNSCRAARIWLLKLIGDFTAMRQTYDDAVRDAQRRGDLYTETTVKRSGTLRWLADDSVPEATAALESTTWMPPEGTFHVQHWHELEARAEIALYGGCTKAEVAPLWPQFKELGRSLLSRVQAIRVASLWMRARLALYFSARGDATCRRRAVSDAVALGKEDRATAGAMAALVRATLERQAGRTAKARSLLEDAMAKGEAAGMAMITVAARHRLGILTEGAEGAALCQRAIEEMTAAGVEAPLRFIQLMAPGFSVDSDG